MQQAISDYILYPLSTYDFTFVFERESMMMEGRRRAADALGLSSPANIDYSLEDRDYLITGLGCGHRRLACVCTCTTRIAVHAR